MKTTKLIWLILFTLSLASGAYAGNGQSRSSALAAEEAKPRSAWERAGDSAMNVSTPRSGRYETLPAGAPSTRYGLIALGILLTISGAIVGLESLFRRAPVGFENENGFCLAEQRRPASRRTFAAGLAALRRGSSGHGVVSSAR